MLSRTQGRLNLGGVNGMGATKFECQPYWDEERGEVGGPLGGAWMVYCVGEKTSKLEFMPVGSAKHSSGISIYQKTKNGWGGIVDRSESC